MGKSKDAQGLPYSYATLPDGPGSSETASSGPWKKRIWAVFAGFLVISLLVAFQCYAASSSDNAPPHPSDDCAFLKSQPETSQVAVPSTKWKPVSRGVSAGVSEKSNSKRLFGSSFRESFPWNNSMLSWQRTAFHFQPEKNWMNGNNSFVIFFLFFVSLALFLH